MHVRPMRFSILSTPTDSSNKTQMMCSTVLLFVYIQKRCWWKKAELQYRVQQQIQIY